MIKLSVSTNPPPQDEVIDYISQLNDLDIDYIHCDVMDGRFVKAKTYGPKMIKLIKANTNYPLDVHLMTKCSCIAKKYIKAGANIVTLHYEIFGSILKAQKALLKIGKLGAMPGIAINPGTPVELIYPLLPYVKVVLIMSVVPGASGQKFIEDTYDRIDKIKSQLEMLEIDDAILAVDGGITPDNAVKLKKLGVDILDVGSCIYKAKDRADIIAKLKA